MDIHDRMDAEILGYLSNNRRTHQCEATKQEIHRHVKVRMEFMNLTLWSKKDVKHALKRLVKQRCITKNDKTYTFLFNPSGNYGGGESDNVNSSACISVAEKKQGASDSGVGEDVNLEGEEKDFEGTSFVLPIAKRMRQTSKQEPIINHNSKASPKIDLDDEIARLEAELAADNCESDDEDSESVEETEQRIIGAKKISFGANSMHEYDTGNGSSCLQGYGCDGNFSASGIISLSNLANGRIEPLPQTNLPYNRRRKLKIDSTPQGDMAEQSNTERKKRKRSSSEPEAEQCHKISAGLKSAVADLLQNYVPSSQLALPFYCRICQHQSSTQDEFDMHRTSDFHKGAVREEQKRTYCKLCRKQLTSIVQMEEHLKSRPHRGKMDFVKGKQRGGLIGVRYGGIGGGGRGRGGRVHWQNQQRGGGGRGDTRQRNDARGRQWC